MLFRISLNRITNIRIPYLTWNFEQGADRHVSNTQATCWCQEFECKQIYRETFPLAVSGVYTDPLLRHYGPQSTLGLQ
jgi:hypothetical protein